MQLLVERLKQVSPRAPEDLGPLRIVPITGTSHDTPEYRLLEGDALQAVEITEVSESGQVPTLKVKNTLDCKVFLLDGQELLGAKQNRILNTDVIVAANTTIEIPVSCVEAGRWGFQSRHFSPGKIASHTVRSRKPGRVHDSLRRSGRHDADQGAVWSEVSESLDIAGSMNATSSMHEAYARRKADLDAAREKLTMPEDAVGFAVFHGSAFQGLDLFDRHSTLKYFWASLIDSYAINWVQALQEGASEDAPSEDEVVEILKTAADGEWESFKSPGQGKDYRLDHERYSGSSLVWRNRVILHLQLFPRRDDDRRDPMDELRRPRIRRPYVY